MAQAVDCVGKSLGTSSSLCNITTSQPQSTSPNSGPCCTEARIHLAQILESQVCCLGNFQQKSRIFDGPKKQETTDSPHSQVKSARPSEFARCGDDPLKSYRSYERTTPNQGRSVAGLLPMTFRMTAVFRPFAEELSSYDNALTATSLLVLLHAARSGRQELLQRLVHLRECVAPLSRLHSLHEGVDVLRKTASVGKKYIVRNVGITMRRVTIAASCSPPSPPKIKPAGLDFMLGKR